MGGGDEGAYFWAEVEADAVEGVALVVLDGDFEVAVVAADGFGT